MKKVLSLFVLTVCVFQMKGQHFSPHISPVHITPHVSSVHVTPHVSSVHVTPHVSSVHVTPHVSSVHVSEPVAHSSSTHISEPVAHVGSVEPVIVRKTPMYRPVKAVNESHIYLDKNTALYYYLILNNHSHKYDTISAPTKTEVKAKVLKATKSEKEDLSKGVILLGGLALLIFFCILLSINLKKSNNQ